MLQTQVFQSFAQRSSRGKVAFVAWATLLGGGYGCYWHQSRRSQKEHLYQKVQSEITEWKPTPISGYQARFYPWTSDVKNWEYKLVKLYGYFRDERVMVRRERDGRPGFLVFAPFVTARHQFDHEDDPQKIANTSVMVNLGWVPRENKLDIKMGSDPLGTTVT